MDWAGDLKLSIKRSAAKMGRRASRKQEEQPTTSKSTSLTSSKSFEKDDSFDIDDEGEPGIVDRETNTFHPKTATVAGWSDSTENSSEKDRFIIASSKEYQTASKSFSFDDDIEDEIPEIPELEDMQDEILMNEPKVKVNPIATAFNDLNKEQGAFSSLEDIDLSLLTKCLRPIECLEESEDVWEWDEVFNEVIASIRVENPKTTKKQSKNDYEENGAHSSHFETQYLD